MGMGQPVSPCNLSSKRSMVTGRITGQPACLKKIRESGLETHERADEPAKKAMQMKFASHGHEAETGLLSAHDRSMIDGLVPEVEIAGTISADLMAEAALEHTGELLTC